MPDKFIVSMSFIVSFLAGVLMVVTVFGFISGIVAPAEAALTVFTLVSQLIVFSFMRSVH